MSPFRLTDSSELTEPAPSLSLLPPPPPPLVEGKVKIQLQCILYIAGLLNLLLGENFSDLLYSLRYNNKEFFNFA